MTKDLALLAGPAQPYRTARLFGEDCPERMAQRVAFGID
jgi:hypothetical protein